MSGKVLLGDLSNGSNFKLALAKPGHRPEGVGFYACASVEGFRDAIWDFLDSAGSPELIAAAFSTSGWDVDGHIDLVHYGFSLEREEVCNLLGVRRISMVNDFVAKALAVPVLDSDERQKVCGNDVVPGQVIAVMGPTAGLGCAFLAPDATGGWVATHCEGGHGDFAPRNALEIEILKLMMLKFGHVSREHGVSAPGLSELWRCISIVEGDEQPAMTVEEILAQAYIGDPRALTAIRTQTELFAGVASDFALTMGAKGGVYLCGTHLTALGDLFDHEVFAKRFYDKGRVSSYVRDIPVYRITTEEPELLGISTLFDGVLSAD